MRAIVYRRYGPPDVLGVEELPDPEHGSGQVRIRVRAAEATKADCELRSFRFPVSWFWLPLRLALGVRRPRRPVLGGYFAGVVDAVGDGVSRFVVGDEVFGCAGLRMGAYGELMVLPASATIVAKPTNVDFESAAVVPLGGLNALHFLRKAKLARGERVLVNGAGGSIGVYGVQIAKALGAHVTAVDSAIKADMLRSIGADEFLDYAEVDFTETGERYDVVFNVVAGRSFGACMATLRPGGRYVMANPRFSDMLRAAATRWSSRRAFFAFAGEREEELDTLRRMIEDGEVVPVVDRTYPMEQAAEAHRRVEAERRIGSVAIAIGPS